MDNDLISRAAAIEAAIDGVDDWDGGYNLGRERYIREHMANVPVVDAVPVVRCERCVHYNTAGVEGQGFGMCHCLGITARDGFFCAFGQSATCGPDYCEIGGDDE